MDGCAASPAAEAPPRDDGGTTGRAEPGLDPDVEGGEGHQADLDGEPGEDNSTLDEYEPVTAMVACGI